MKNTYLSIGRLERTLANSDKEELIFHTGVNLLVGRSSTGKTKWLQTLDYLLGDSDVNPFEGIDDVSDKYIAAGAELIIDNQSYWVERKWKEKNVKSKIFFDNDVMTTSEFQHRLMSLLNIPILHYPKGNPMSGQTWPELSFRVLLRHIYRQQRFWGGLVPQQSDNEQLASILQILGVAEDIYTENYGELIKKRIRLNELIYRQRNYQQSLNEVTRELLRDSTLSVGVSDNSIEEASRNIASQTEDLRDKRVALIKNAQGSSTIHQPQGYIENLVESRIKLIDEIDIIQSSVVQILESIREAVSYRAEVESEINRLARAGDAGEILADVKISHCPACDQSVIDSHENTYQCFLCHQELPSSLKIKELGALRIKFEYDRLDGELKETDELLVVLKKDKDRLNSNLSFCKERLATVENQLAPTRELIAGLVQGEISIIDMKLGELSERQRQVGRIKSALELGKQLDKQISAIEKEIKPLEKEVKELVEGVDFSSQAELLEEGMNQYLKAINILRPGVWQHSSISLVISRYSFDIKVGKRTWAKAIGGTDALYLLMAYQFGLLSLSNKEGCHYPGISIIDVPGEFSGEEVKDKENFIVQPFIDLLNKPGYEHAQLIITGVSFLGLKQVHRLVQTKVYKA